MSKPALDSDLYGDIYGDDELTELLPPETAFEDVDAKTDGQISRESPPPATEAPELKDKKPSPLQETHSSLPPKPLSPNSLSYSAQVAQQFSAYQQTPSQERQQRTEIPLPPNPRMSGTSTSNMIKDTPSTADSVFGKKPSEMHDSGKLFIGGLNWDTTDGILSLCHVTLCSANGHLLVFCTYFLFRAEGLRNYFSQFGKVDACTIMRDPSGTSRGFAFLTFEDASAVDVVVAREHWLDGKAIDPKRAIPREEHLRNTRYFVGGLAPTTTSESMKEFFSTYGKVVDATVMVDRESGRSKGFGFVTYEDAVNAEQLVGKIGLILDDKQIEVKMAQPRSQRDQVRTTPGNISTNVGRDPTSMNQALQNVVPNMGFAPQQQTNQMGMLFNRPMGQVAMMGGNMPMMNINPMAMAAMGMGMNVGGFNPMAAGLNGMNGMNMMGMNGMNNMGGMNGMNMNAMAGMGNMGAMRLGMGPMGIGGTGMGAGMNGTGMVGGGGMGGMNTVAMGMRPNMVLGGGMNTNLGRMSMNTAATGSGPTRISTRGQHSFHPYSR